MGKSLSSWDEKQLGAYCYAVMLDGSSEDEANAKIIAISGDIREYLAAKYAPYEVYIGLELARQLLGISLLEFIENAATQKGVTHESA